MGNQYESGVRRLWGADAAMTDVDMQLFAVLADLAHRHGLALAALEHARSQDAGSLRLVLADAPASGDPTGPADAARYAREGAQALLIGEALVKNGDPQQGLADIITACADATNASAVEGTPT